MSKAKVNESSVLFTDKELYDLLINDVNEALNFLTKNKDSLLIPSKQEYLYDEFINLVSKNFLDVPSSKTMFPKKTSYVQERVRSFIEHLRDMSKYNNICINIILYSISLDILFDEPERAKRIEEKDIDYLLSFTCSTIKDCFEDLGKCYFLKEFDLQYLKEIGFI